MPESSSGVPYREKSLERLSSPERLDQLLEIVDQKSWAPLLALCVLSVLLLAWSVFGRIPVNVEGRGIVIRPRKVVELQAPGDGQVVRLAVGVDQRVERGQLIARIARPELEKRLESQRARLEELTLRARDAGLLRARRTEVESDSARNQGQGLRRNIDATTDLAVELRDLGLRAIEDERALLQQQWQLARELPQALQQRLTGQRALFEEKILSRAELVEAEEAYVDSLRRVSDLEAQLNRLRTRELEVHEEYEERLQRIADRTFELQGLEVREKELAQENHESAASYEEQISDTRREIARLEVLLADEGEILAEQPGRILELSAALGQVVERGERVGALEVEDAGSPLASVIYFTVRDGKKLSPGMRALITPDTVERQRYGSIEGRVGSVSPFPIAPDEVEKIVGNRVVAERLIAGGYLMQVHAALAADADRPGRYRWTSSDGPPLAVSAGTTATARVTVERHPPITFVLPFLKSATGID